MANNLIRVNTRIPKKINDWLDEESENSGISKSTLIHMALETFYTQRRYLENMDNVVRELQELKNQLPVKD